MRYMYLSINRLQSQSIYLTFDYGKMFEKSTTISLTSLYVENAIKKSLSTVMGALHCPQAGGVAGWGGKREGSLSLNKTKCSWVLLFNKWGARCELRTSCDFSLENLRPNGDVTSVAHAKNFSCKCV